MIRATTARLPVPSAADRAAIAALPRTVAAHDAHLATVPAMTTVETGGTAPAGPLAFPLRVAAWNLERCLFPKASAALLAGTGAQAVLLSEMDKGMARTAQRHPTAEIAATLGMGYAYGVEFLELGLGSETERGFCTDDFNACGFHGNALMAAALLHAPFLLRLPGRRFWFMSGGDQPRLGERMALGATVATTQGPLVLISTHLESNADAAGRAAQLRALIDTAEAAFPGLPMLIGGDLNTGNHIGGDWRAETLFDLARARGFHIHGGPENQPTTRPSLITRWPDRAMKLDWFLTRGLCVTGSAILPALDPAGGPLSDHDPVLIDIAGFTPPAA